MILMRSQNNIIRFVLVTKYYFLFYILFRCPTSHGTFNNNNIIAPSTTKQLYVISSLWWKPFVPPPVLVEFISNVHPNNYVQVEIFPYGVIFNRFVVILYNLIMNNLTQPNLTKRNHSVVYVSFPTMPKFIQRVYIIISKSYTSHGFVYIFPFENTIVLNAYFQTLFWVQNGHTVKLLTLCMYVLNSVIWLSTSTIKFKYRSILLRLIRKMPARIHLLFK